MSRDFGKSVDNLSDRAAIGGNSQPGPRGAVTQYTSGAENVIQFLPRGRSTSAPSNSRAQSRELSILTIDVREIGAMFLVVALATVAVSFVASVAFLYLTLVD